MFTFILVVALLLVALVASSLRPVYKNTPTKELLRESKNGDMSAKALYSVSKYGVSADVFLFLVSATLSALAFVLITTSFNIFWSTLLIAVLVFIIFYIVPLNHKKLPIKVAKKVSPYISKVLSKVPKVVERNMPVTVHAGLYEKEDLLELLQKQKEASHNRIEKSELDIAYHSLTFGDKKVTDFMTPKKVAHTVSSEDPIGPVLLTELYDSGFSRFPVRNEEKDSIVGTLYLKDLVEKKATGIVSNVMSPKVFYVNETDKLKQVLDAFLKTKHHLFIVVNEFEEMVGVITIEDVLEQVIGLEITDEFDKHEDLREVARKSAKLDSKNNPRP